MSPQIRGKVRLHAGGIKAGRHSPVPGFVAVNAMHRFGISPPKCASATGSPRLRRLVGPGLAGVVRKDEGVSMKRSWTALAVALVAIVAVAGCNDYGNTFQNNTGAILSFLSPSQIPACPPAPATCVDLTLMLNGNGFVLKTVVQWNGKPLATTVAVDSTGAALGILVTAVVPAALLAKPGTATVLTKNPASGAGQNGLSNTVTFIIDNPSNPVPSVSAVSPTCAAPGVDLPLVVTGTNFLSASGGSSQVSTLIWTFGGSQFQFTAPAATITTTQITVT